MFMSAISAAEAAPAALPFDLALAQYEALARADDLDRSDGALRRAYDEYDRDTTQLVEEFGHRAAMPAEAKVKWESAWERMQQAEKHHTERFTEPRWQAACDLFAIPAPSMAAVLRKLEVAKGEDVIANDVIAFVEADLRWLASHAALWLDR